MTRSWNESVSQASNRNFYSLWNIPFRARLDDLDQLQLLQVIAPDCPLGRHKEQRPERMESSCLCEAGQFPERYLREVLRERVDCHRAALPSGGDGRKVIASPVPVDNLDCRSHGDPYQNTFVLELGARPGPFRRRLLACREGLLLSVCRISEASRKDVPACLVESRSDAGVRGDHQEDILTRGRSQDEGILRGPPPDRVDGLLTAEPDGPNLPTSEQLPNPHSAVVATSCKRNTSLSLG